MLPLIHHQPHIFHLQFILNAQFNEIVFSFTWVLIFLILALSAPAILFYSSFLACVCFYFEHIHYLYFSSSRSSLSAKLALCWNFISSHKREGLSLFPQWVHFEGFIQLCWARCPYVAASQRILLSISLTNQVCSLKVLSPSSAVLFLTFLQILNSITLHSLQPMMPTVMAFFISPSQSVSSKSQRAAPLASLSNAGIGNVSPSQRNLELFAWSHIALQQFSGQLRPPITICACRWGIFSRFFWRRPLPLFPISQEVCSRLPRCPQCCFSVWSWCRSSQ